MGLSAAVSLGHDPWSGSVTASPERRAARGRTAARVFIDENSNGRFDQGDLPLPQVQIQANRTRTKARTGAEGTVVIDDLPAYRDVNLSVYRNSIEDPYLVPAVEGLRLTARPGSSATIEFPMLRTGEIDGTVYRGGGVGARGLAGVRLELLNAAGETVATTKTEFDGFYLFELVPLGHYRIRVSPDQLARLSLGRPIPQDATLSTDEPVVSGLDFTVPDAEAGGDVVASAQGPRPVILEAAVSVPAGETSVIVQPGDSLWRIARRVYGRGIRFSVIYRANKDRIRDPDLIYPGQIIVVPGQQEQKAGRTSKSGVLPDEIGEVSDGGRVRDLEAIAEVVPERDFELGASLHQAKEGVAGLAAKVGAPRSFFQIGKEVSPHLGGD